MKKMQIAIRKADAANLIKKILLFFTVGMFLILVAAYVLIFFKSALNNSIYKTAKEVRFEIYSFRILNCFKPDKGTLPLDGMLVIDIDKFTESRLEECFNDNTTYIALQLRDEDKKILQQPINISHFGMASPEKHKQYAVVLYSSKHGTYSRGLLSVDIGSRQW